MKDNAVVTCLGWIALIVSVFIVSAMLNGWALSTLWQWFVVPLFKLPTLTWAQVAGLASIVSFLIAQEIRRDGSKDSTETAIALTVSAIARPLMAVAFGWVIYQFVA